MHAPLIESIKKHQFKFGLNLESPKIELLADFFELIQSQNEILHLVAPSSPEEFAVRHFLESLTLLEFLPHNAVFADIGPGAGFPSVPCLLVRDDLCGVLIESKPKKARFLEEVSAKFQLGNRIQIINRQFEEAETPDAAYVICRALDKFPKKLPKLIRWSKGNTLLLFGGIALGEELARLNMKFDQKLTPMSEKRFLFIVQN